MKNKIDLNRSNIDQKSNPSRINSSDSSALAIRKKAKNRLINYINSLYPRPILIDISTMAINEWLDKQGAPK